MRTLLLMTSLILLPACQPDARTEPQPVAQAEGAAARAAVEQVRDAWVAAAERDDANAIAELYADDGAVIDPTEYAPLVGREAIRNVLTQELPVVNGLELRSKELHVSGDLAYDFGEFSERVEPPGAQPIPISGHYLLILRRQENGAWKLVKKIAMMSPKQLAQGSAE